MTKLDYEDDDDSFECDTETVSAQIKDFFIDTLDVNDNNSKKEIYVTALLKI